MKVYAVSVYITKTFFSGFSLVLCVSLKAFSVTHIQCSTGLKNGTN